jgi:Flp pilus assembly protein TadB
MGLGLDPVTSVTVICAIGVALTFGLIVLALSGSAADRRFNRRVNTMRDRAQGVLASEAAATRSLSRQQGASAIDRLARTWLPRRDLLVARLGRTGRAISIGQYATACAVLTVLATVGLAAVVRIGIVPSLVLGLLIGIALGKAPPGCLHQSVPGGDRSDRAGAAFGFAGQRSDRRSRPRDWRSGRR